MNTKVKQKTGMHPSAVCLFAVFAIIAILILAGCSGKNGTVTQTPKQEIKEGEDLVISVSEISNTAKFYPVTVNGTAMEIIAVKASDGSIRTAFNTCQVCYDSGRGYYKQEGDQLVCQNCGNKFTMDCVEVKSGGCNPWPIFAKNKTVTDETITISYNFLNEAKQIFANWKTSY